MEFVVHTDRGPMRIGANSQKKAEDIARSDGHRVVEYYFPGDIVEWVSTDHQVGPFGHTVAIVYGERRTVDAYKNGSIILRGRNNTGMFGWVDVKNVKLVSRVNKSQSEDT